jgi:hypothetical protein
MSTPHTNVVVNFEVTIDASGAISVFGQDASGVSNVVVAERTLDVKSLYEHNATKENAKRMFEFWEPSGNMGERVGVMAGDTTEYSYPAAVPGRAYTELTGLLSEELHAVFNDNMDASGAQPFFDYKGDAQQHYRHESFGRLALSAYAHYIFGHVAATAAITNDQAFIDYMNEEATGAAIPLKLVNAITSKLSAAVTAIVNQVIGQDASRAMDQDNNELAPGVRHALKFYAGDVIYVNVRLGAPDVTVGLGQKQLAADLEAKYIPVEEDKNYTIKITLA